MVGERVADRLAKVAGPAQIADFDAIIDARSPAEYAEDHIPDAINCPVLDNEQRARVGAIYLQESPFEAKKLGAALVARNIADHIEHQFLSKPRTWRPLVYCWRGGQRSSAFVHILRQIGWDAHRLEGGYKAWRRSIIDELATLPLRFKFCVISGATGSGKSRLLEALAQQGAQVLHLEQLAEHKGSLLGNLPGATQPSQKMFETRLHGALTGFNAEQPVFVEAESRRIGDVQMPNTLLDMIRAAPSLCIEASFEARVEFLLSDYAYFLEAPDWLRERIQRLRGMHSNQTIERWLKLVADGEFRTLVEELLKQHYDPHYLRSQSKNFAGFHDARPYETNDLSTVGIGQMAHAILASTRGL